MSWRNRADWPPIFVVSGSGDFVMEGCSLAIECRESPEGGLTARVQTLMAACGIAPFSGSMLTGACGPAATVIIADSSGNPVAAAHAYLPHNAFSRYHSYAWGGLVSVAQTQRGKGVGSFINARVIVSAFERLGASHVYELISAANLPSRRMAEACGLRHEAGLVCGVAVREGGVKFTR